ncbi:MAG TPA: GntR family transcriptional regulator [Gemmatimonadales bacterium]|nr:GntR family transcriptional regulator [Gemmatimonadales bacterium]
MLAPRAPLRAQVRDAILRLLEGGELAGTRVRDTDLATRLGVSRTPVREALLDLVRTGVLVSDHGRGFRVAPLDPVEVRELGQMLGALEASALRLSAPFSPARLADLERAVAGIDAARGDASLVLDRNEEWHLILLEGCPNRRLRERLADLRGATRRYVLAFLREAGRLGLATGGHRRVLSALQRGDQPAAARALEEQLVSGTDELAGWLARRPPQALGSSRSSGSR